LQERATDEITAWVGLDWADQQHAYALRMKDSDEIERGTIEQTPEQLQAWVNQLRKRSGGGWVAVAVEQSRGGLLYALMDYEFLLIYPINPKGLANYRKAFYPSGGKDDPKDADLVLDYLCKHRDRIRLWQPESAPIRCLRLLTEERRKLVNLRTRLTNQWTANLKQYYPQALGWAGPLKETRACDFLERWPNLQELQQVKSSRIRRFFRRLGVRSLQNLEQKLTEIRQAQALTDDEAILTVGSLTTQSLARQIRQVNHSIEEFDRRIAELFNAHDDHFIFKSLPGSGPALGPRLLTLFGEDRERFDSAEQVQTISGIAPLIEQSGKGRIVHYRWACPRFIRQSVHEFAAHSRRWCPWAAAYYRLQINRGKDHHVAVRALAFKWLRIIFRCWKNRTPYNNELYLASLRANNAPLLAYLETT
jgi:transposase